MIAATIPTRMTAPRNDGIAYRLDLVLSIIQAQSENMIHGTVASLNRDRERFVSDLVAFEKSQLGNTVYAEEIRRRIAQLDQIIPHLK